MKYLVLLKKIVAIVLHLTFLFNSNHKKKKKKSVKCSYASTFKTFNPLLPSVPICHRLAKLSTLILEGIIKKNSYERPDYESVDEKSLS